MWLGYQQSLRPCQTGLVLNIDIAATAFLEPLDVIPFLNNALGRGADVTRGLNPMQLKKAARVIRGVQVTVQTTLPCHQAASRQKITVDAHRVPSAVYACALPEGFGLEQHPNARNLQQEQCTADFHVCRSLGSCSRPLCHT